MHPLLSRGQYLALYVVTWLAAGALIAAGLEGGEGRLGAALAVIMPTAVVFGVLCLPPTWYLSRAFPLGPRTSMWRLLAAHALASALSSSVWGLLTAAWARVLDRWGASSSAAAVYADRAPTLFLIGILLYGLAAAVHYLFTAVEASREAERRALERDLLTREAELKAIRAQIDPHFMFNSLHSISALTTTDPPAARRMCMLLADFLRDTLRLGANRRITLADEFALTDRFLAIEQIRFGPRLRIERRADPDAGLCLVPPLILQPLVENAVAHGIGHLVDGGTIVMTAGRSASMLTITLENPCDRDRPRSRGVGLGLELLRQRLTTQYGLADLVSARETDGRFRVELRLPAETPS